MLVTRLDHVPEELVVLVHNLFHRSLTVFGQILLRARRVLLVGILNTLLVAALGIFLATLLGFALGIAGVSRNWLIRALTILGTTCHSRLAGRGAEPD